MHADFAASVLNPDHAQQGPTTFGLQAGSEGLSGGGSREDERVQFGYSLLRGKRPDMEDFYHAQFREDSKTGEAIGLFGIFDGHGGPNAADFVRSNLFNNLFQSKMFPADVTSAITEAYESTDRQYLRHAAQSGRDDGCTAVTAVVWGSRLCVANVGDSRAVLSKAGKAVPVSVDHKPSAKEERERIEAAGGVIVWSGTWRVQGMLAVSRAFGDRALKRYVIATPEVLHEDLTTEHEFLILASDGLWDVVSNQEAVSMIRDLVLGDGSPEQAAQALTEQAYHRGSNDNISCVVIKFAV